MGTIPLDAALAAHEQTARDLQRAMDNAMANDRVANMLAVGMALGSLRYVEKHGLTYVGRKSLTTAIEALRSILGVEE